MAIVFSSLFKKLKGKIDNLVFYESRGQTRLRSQTANDTTPSTPAQLLQQGRLRTAVSFYRANAGSALPHIWRTAAKGKVMSGYNLFLRENMAVFDADFRISDYAQLHVSRGQLEFPQSLRLSSYGEGEACVEWRNVLPPTSLHMSDLLHAFWLADDGTFTLRTPVMSPARRDACRATLPLPDAGRRGMHLYLYFSDQEEKRFSPDRYFHLPALS